MCASSLLGACSTSPPIWPGLPWDRGTPACQAHLSSLSSQVLWLWAARSECH